MKVLFVEDDDVKRNRVSSFLSDTIVGVDLRVARSLQSGLRRLREETYSLIILDMTLPNYDPGPNEPGGKPQLFGGREFLRQMERFDITTPVIVVTQFAAFGRGSNLVNLKDLDKELRQEHAGTYKGAIYYNPAILGWTTELESLLRNVFGEAMGK